MSDSPHYDPRAEQAACPNKEGHTICPKGYIAWHAWAEKMSKTHQQIQCPGCGYWMIWVLK
jgi:hypothetical protein